MPPNELAGFITTQLSAKFACLTTEDVEDGSSRGGSSPVGPLPAEDQLRSTEVNFPKGIVSGRNAIGAGDYLKMR
jgi:hypothetical protein